MGRSRENSGNISLLFENEALCDEVQQNTIKNFKTGDNGLNPDGNIEHTDSTIIHKLDTQENPKLLVQQVHNMRTQIGDQERSHVNMPSQSQAVVANIPTHVDEGVEQDESDTG